MRQLHIVLLTHFARIAARQRLRLERSAKKLRPHRHHEEASAVRRELIGRPFEAFARRLFAADLVRQRVAD